MPEENFTPRESAERLRRAVLGLVGATVCRSRQEALAHGLSNSQLFVLLRLQTEGSLPTTSWARELGITASSLSGLLDGLVRAGLVQRAREPPDRRLVHVSLSTRGIRLMKKLDKEHRVAWGKLVESIPRTELDRSSAVLERLSQAIRGRPDRQKHGNSRHRALRETGPTRKVNPR